MKRNKEIAKAILENVGGKDNITNCFHCITRLRLEFKDKSLIKKESIEAIDGVIALKIQGEQYQIVIGQNVGEVYREFCDLTGFEVKAAINENLDEKKTISLKGIGNGIVQAVVNSMVPALPILIGAGMFKVIALLLLQFHILDATNSTYLVIQNIGEAGFYFLPIYVGINASKHFKTSLPLATLLCAFLLLPAFTTGLTEGTITTIFGLPITATSYASSVLPAILITWILSYVHKFFTKYVPQILSSVLVPTLTLLVMAPLAICFLGPLGTVLGKYLADGLMWIYNTLGFVGMAVMGALLPLLIFTGMHTALIPFALTSFAENGYETFFFVTGIGYVFGSAASCLAVSLKSKKVDTKATAMTCATTALVGGITEPALYGVLMKLKRPLIATMIGNAVASAYFGITHTFIYAMPGSTGLFVLPTLIGPTGANLVNGIIGLVISMVISFIMTWILGFKED